mmetsp:Transcript_10521/g.17012  ORF Transcript_10521/g.17012 Transcript_10521/m.17012 type:complete len:87 (-) Transcript_10521:63-323(-)
MSNSGLSHETSAGLAGVDIISLEVDRTTCGGVGALNALVCTHARATSKARKEMTLMNAILLVCSLSAAAHDERQWRVTNAWKQHYS